MDWHFNEWVPEMTLAMCEQLVRADTIVLGRHTYTMMADYWPQAARSCRISRDDLAFADMMNRYRKIIFSRTLSCPNWKNSVVVKGGVEEEIGKLKSEPGKNLMVYGSGRLVQSLMDSGLVDEFHLWLHPSTIGSGERLFEGIRGRMKLLPSGVKVFDSGVILLTYSS